MPATTHSDNSSFSTSSKNSLSLPPPSLLKAAERHIKRYEATPDEACTLCGRRLIDGLCMQCSHHICLVCASLLLDFQELNHPSDAARRKIPFIKCRKCFMETFIDDVTLKRLVGEALRHRVLRHPSHRSGAQLQYFESYLSTKRKKHAYNKSTKSFEPEGDESVCCCVCDVGGDGEEGSSMTKGDAVETSGKVASRLQHKSTLKTGEDISPAPTDVGDADSNHDPSEILRRREIKQVQSDANIPLSDILISPSMEMMVDLKTATRVSIACVLHSKQPAEYFCLTCYTGCVCSQCVIFGFHDGHSIDMIEDSWRDVQSTILDPWKLELESSVKDLEYVMEILAMKQREWKSFRNCNNNYLTYTTQILKDILTQSRDINEAFLKACHQSVRVRAHALRVQVQQDRRICEDLAKTIRSQRPLSNSIKLLRFFASNVKNIQFHVQQRYASNYTAPTDTLMSMLSMLHKATQSHTNVNTEVTCNLIRKTILELPASL